MDFTVSYEALCQAYDWDVDTFDTEHHVEWIPLLAYTAARTGGEFDKKALKILNETAEKLAEGEAEIETLTKDMKYYPYYLEAYSAALGGLVGEYEAEVIGEDGQSTWQKKYGLKGYCPIARGFDYTHYDDFGAGRSYGYKRRHLGHDMMGLVGVPIIAVESGTVEALGWNPGASRRSAGTSTAAGALVSAALIISATITMHICGRTTPMRKDWKKAAW